MLILKLQTLGLFPKTKYFGQKLKKKKKFTKNQCIKLNENDLKRISCFT